MAQSIEAYISCNQKLTTQWLVRTLGYYARNTIEFDTALERSINSNYICSDARRTHKMIEVLRHYNLIDSACWQSDAYRFGCRQGGHYELHINHKAFRKIGKQYGERYDFKTIAPKSGMDRVKSYPTIQAVSLEGVIHYVFNQNQYELFDRIEPEGKENPRRIRLYPKSLEKKAEMKLFTNKVKRYYSYNMEAFVELMFGFKPEVLMTDRSNIRGEDRSLLKNLRVDRVNEIGIDDIDKKDIQERLKEARELKEYADASVRDLEKLVTLVPANHDKIMKTFYKKADEHLSLTAPMLINNEDKGLRTLAALIMKGSNKGLI
jgi:hypothetical protein